MPKRALVLIDIQNDYFPGGKWTLRGIESAADNAARVLAAARAAGLNAPLAVGFSLGTDGKTVSD